MSSILVSPHNDDAVLFASFTIQREKPLVVVVFDSYVQPARGFAGCSKGARRSEDSRALTELGIRPDVWYLGFRDDAEMTMELQGRIQQGILEIRHFLGREHPADDNCIPLWAPAYEDGGHEQHNTVALACMGLNTPETPVHQYLTYRRGKVKSRPTPEMQLGTGRLIWNADNYPTAKEVLPRSGEEIARKHRALACYTSQMDMTPGIECWPWFMEDLREYELG
jgi:LmbE family N-acetylglucosaminyl deacetylase